MRLIVTNWFDGTQLDMTRRMILIIKCSSNVCFVCTGDECLPALGVVRGQRWDRWTGSERWLSSVVRQPARRHTAAHRRARGLHRLRHVRHTPPGSLFLVSSAHLTCPVRLYFRLFLSRGADIDIMNKEGDTPLSLARSDTPVWVALQINRKLRRGIANRVVRTERIICRSVCVSNAENEMCVSVWF